MKKTMLIQEVSQKTKLSKEEVAIIVNSILDSITNALTNKESVSFLGFGSFKPIKKREREVYIPGTNQKVKIKEKYSVKFTPSKKLKFLMEDIID